MDSLSPEQNARLDRWSDELQGLVHMAVDQSGPAARRFKNWLNRVWLGHPLHPALTDPAISAWLGGGLVFALGTNVSRAAFEPGVEQFTPVIGADALEPG
jgi:hypothetical protein